VLSSATHLFSHLNQLYPPSRLSLPICKMRDGLDIL
jgi:hypothetical protein